MIPLLCGHLDVEGLLSCHLLLCHVCLWALPSRMWSPAGTWRAILYCLFQDAFDQDVWPQFSLQATVAHKIVPTLGPVSKHIVVVQLLSHVWLFVTPWTAAYQAPLSSSSSQSLLKCMSIESVTLSNCLILCHPLLLLSSVFPSIGLFSNESALHIRWSKYWSFTFSSNPSNEYSELILFRIEWFQLLAVQVTLKSFLQHHNSKASILWCVAFFMIQLSHIYMTTGKTMPLTIWTFVGKVLCFLIHCLGLSQLLLISRLQSPSSVILEPKKIKSVTASIYHKAMGLDVMILGFFFFFNLGCKPAFSLSSFTLIKRLFSSSLLSAIRVVSSAYPKLLIFLPAILIPACDSSSLAFHMMYSVYNLDKLGDNIQPWHTPFPIWNQSVVPCLVLNICSSLFAL